MSDFSGEATIAIIAIHSPTERAPQAPQRRGSAINEGKLKKNPNRIRVGIVSVGGAGGNRTRVRKSSA